MNHCIFPGDVARLVVDVDCGEYIPRNPDHTGFYMTARTGTDITFRRHDGEHFVFTYDDGPWVDLEVHALASEFAHDHGVCEDVFDEHQAEAHEWVETIVSSK